MTALVATPAPTRSPASYKSDLKPIWCRGCGDFGALSAFYKALSTQNVDPNDLVFVSGIGCSGRFPHFVETYSFHSTHGRALPVATGLKVARPELPVAVVGGDGDGLAIGMGHIPHAARRNVDITYVLLDNEIYGLTKGQSSPTTPFGAHTPGGMGATKDGHWEERLDPLAIYIASGATFVACGFTGVPAQLAGIFSAALAHKGFSIVHTYSPCTTFNHFLTFDSIKERLGQIPEDHDPTDRLAAMRYALDHEQIWTGIYYQVERPTLDGIVDAQRREVGDRRTALLDLLRGFE
jgi:2-oxoglutarate ferredoxin oxidoreductase subunit beta